MIDLSVLCSVQRGQVSLLSGLLALRGGRVVTMWIDPSAHFLGRMSATLGDGAGWRETLEIDVDDCVGCSYSNAVRACLQRVRETGRYEAAVLELAPSVEPDAALEALCATLDPAWVRLDTVVTILQGGLWLEQLSSGATFGEIGIGVHAQDDRAVPELIASQISAADCLIVYDEQLRADEAAALQVMAPNVATVVTADPFSIGSELVIRTGRHQPRCLNAFDSEGLLDWSADLPPLDCGLDVVRWSADRPLHPERLHDALEAISDQVIRSTGSIVIASTSDRRTRWESAGEVMSLGDLGPREDTSLASRLTFLGAGLEANRIGLLLDMCLVTDEEYAAGPRMWHRLADPFAVSGDEI